MYRGAMYGKPVPLEEFKRHARGEYPILYGEFTRGVAEVLELTDKEKAELALA